jgi:hypothetical protein
MIEVLKKLHVEQDKILSAIIFTHYYPNQKYQFFPIIPFFKSSVDFLRAFALRSKNKQKKTHPPHANGFITINYKLSSSY